jgi:dTDP-4-dehydrorhamnose 3,5-epimerase-like enzyme
MGLIQVPEIEAYWSTKWNCSIPFFARVFPRERFEQLFWMLHVSQDDPLHPKQSQGSVRSTHPQISDQLQTTM